MDIVVLALDDARLASIGNCLDAFAIARERVARTGPAGGAAAEDIRLRILSPRGRDVRTADGRTIAADGGLRDQSATAVVHVASFAGRDTANLVARVTDDHETLDWLRDRHAHGALISATGPSAFLAAQAGLLAGGIAAVQRSLAPLFHARYPGVRIETRMRVAEHAGVFTATGLSAEFQMMTRLVERVMSQTAAGWLARVTAVEGAQEGLLDADPLVADAQIWLSERFAQPVKVSDLAAALAVSHQTLIRHFRVCLGTTPRAYLQLLRIEAAQAQLLRSNRSIAEIATLVGYDDMKSFRAAFRARTGTSASAFRADAGAARGNDASTPP